LHSQHESTKVTNRNNSVSKEGHIYIGDNIDSEDRIDGKDTRTGGSFCSNEVLISQLYIMRSNGIREYSASKLSSYCITIILCNVKKYNLGPQESKTFQFFTCHIWNMKEILV
jgi:hypothetical protein